MFILLMMKPVATVLRKNRLRGQEEGTWRGTRLESTRVKFKTCGPNVARHAKCGPWELKISDYLKINKSKACIDFISHNSCWSWNQWSDGISPLDCSISTSMRFSTSGIEKYKRSQNVQKEKNSWRWKAVSRKMGRWIHVCASSRKTGLSFVLWGSVGCQNAQSMSAFWHQTQRLVCQSYPSRKENCSRIKRQTTIAAECVHESLNQKHCGSES